MLPWLTAFHMSDSTTVVILYPAVALYRHEQPVDTLMPVGTLWSGIGKARSSVPVLPHLLVAPYLRLLWVELLGSLISAGRGAVN
jgi:hypothetical protein